MIFDTIGQVQLLIITVRVFNLMTVVMAVVAVTVALMLVHQVSGDMKAYLCDALRIKNWIYSDTLFFYPLRMYFCDCKSVYFKN